MSTIETKYATIDRDELKRLQADSAELARLRVAVEDERSAFEEFHRERCFELRMDQSDIDSEFDRDADGEYIYVMALDGWKSWEERATRAIASRHPEGWKLVPVEPTPEMLSAIVREADRQESYWAYKPEKFYSAMLAAAPQEDKSHG